MRSVWFVFHDMVAIYLVYIFTCLPVYERDVYDINGSATSPYLSACYASICNTHRYNFSDLSAAPTPLLLHFSMHVQMFTHNSTLNSTTI